MKPKNYQKIYKLFQSLHSQTYTHPLSFHTHLLTSHKNFPEIESTNKYLFSIKIKKEHCNIHKTLYGGAASTLLDYTTSFALMINDKKNNYRKSMSLNLITNFVGPIFLESEILILAETEKIGRNIGHSKFRMIDDKDKLLCYGTHMAFMQDPLVFNNGLGVNNIVNN